jgi:hypothetical protein
MIKFILTLLMAFPVLDCFAQKYPSIDSVPGAPYHLFYSIIFPINLIIKPFSAGEFVSLSVSVKYFFAKA